MTVYVDSIGVIAREPDVVSPELALVDPELRRAARALLECPPAVVRSEPLSSSSARRVTLGAWAPVEPVRPVRERNSRRLLVGVAAATMLALLLLDVRVQIGDRPAAAESSGSAAGTSSGAPGPSSPPMPVPPAPRPRPALAKKPFRTTERRFAWAPIRGASGYHVEFFRGSSRVFVKQTTSPSVTVPPRWTIDGRRRSLRPGVYRWYVWPIVQGERQSQAVVQAIVSIPAS